MLNETNESTLDIDPGQKKKKQQLVKHKRKNWKKLDISEVEQGIEELRQQELTGGVLAEKKDEELFFIDRTKLPLDDVGSIIPEPVKKKPRLTLEEKMAQLNCYKNLQPDPNSAPAHIIRSLKKAEDDSKRQLALKKREMKKLQSRLAAKKRLINKKPNMEEPTQNQESSEITKETKRKQKKLNVLLDASFNRELWNSSDLPEITDTNEYYLRSTKKIPIIKPKNPLYKQSLIPHVEVPHPGTSYNPDYDDHQALLLKAHTIELKKLQDEQKLMRKLALSAKKMSWNEMEKMWLEEMSVRELFEPKKADEEEADKTEENNEAKNEISISKRELRRRMEKINNGRKANDTKAKRERRKLLEKIKLRQKENERLVRIQQNEIYRLKTLKKEVEAKLKNEEEMALKRKENEEHKHLYEQKRLGRLKFEDEELELKLSEEITGNLRNLKPEGNILRDRYKSFQKRNLLEPREKAKGKNKYGKKRFQKRNAYEVTNYVR